MNCREGSPSHRASTAPRPSWDTRPRLLGERKLVLPTVSRCLLWLWEGPLQGQRAESPRSGVSGAWTRGCGGRNSCAPWDSPREVITADVV